MYETYLPYGLMVLGFILMCPKNIRRLVENLKYFGV